MRRRSMAASSSGATQVAVGEHAQQAVLGVDHGRHAQACASSPPGLRTGGIAVHARHRLAGVHHVADVQQQAAAEGTGGMRAGEIVGREAARFQGRWPGVAIARAAVVLAVGARPSGQASAGTDIQMRRPCRPAGTNRCRSWRSSGMPWRRISGRMVRSSSVSPELDSASTTSLCVIMPRSPWLASPGCTKKAGVPVEARSRRSCGRCGPDSPCRHHHAPGTRA